MAHPIIHMRSINTTPASRRATPRFARRLALPLLALTCGATVASANIFQVDNPIDTNFTTAANWVGGTAPTFGAMATTDSITVRYENTSSGAPALINTSVTGFGFFNFGTNTTPLGHSFARLTSGNTLRGQNLYIAHTNFSQATFTVSTGSTLNATVFNNGVLGVAHTGQANATGASGRLILESEATASWSRLAVGTGGTVEWKAGANSFTTLTLTSTTVASLFDGKLSFDLGSLTTGGTFTVVNTNSGGGTPSAITGLLLTSESGFNNFTDGSISGTGSVSSTHYEFTNADNWNWSLALADSGRDLQLTVSAIPEPSTFAALAGIAGLGLASLRRRRRLSA